MSPQIVPTTVPIEQIPANLQKATGSNPVAPTTPFQPIPDNPPLADSQPAQESAPLPPSRPQSSPKRRTLTRAEMASLVAVVEYLADELEAFEHINEIPLNHIGRHVLKLRGLL